MSFKRSRSEVSAEQEGTSSNTMEYSFDVRAIIHKQKRLEFSLEHCIHQGIAITDYDSIKYKEVTYRVGDYVELHDAEGVHPYVARLKRIVKLPPNIERMPFLQVEWCLNKGDLPKQIVDKFSEHMSDAEVFPSPKSLFCVYVESIKGKCFLLSYEEYSEMSTSYEYYYFSRASFDEESETVVPSPETWKKECYCNKPLNPDRVYVQCQACPRWFHESCLGNIDMEKSFICKECSK